MFPKTCGGHGDLGPIRKRHSGGTEKRNEGLRRDTLSGEFQWLGSLHNLFFCPTGTTWGAFKALSAMAEMIM